MSEVTKICDKFRAYTSDIWCCSKKIDKYPHLNANTFVVFQFDNVTKSSMKKMIREIEIHNGKFYHNEENDEWVFINGSTHTIMLANLYLAYNITYKWFEFYDETQYKQTFVSLDAEGKKIVFDCGVCAWASGKNENVRMPARLSNNLTYFKINDPVSGEAQKSICEAIENMGGIENGRLFYTDADTDGEIKSNPIVMSFESFALDTNISIGDRYNRCFDIRQDDYIVYDETYHWLYILSPSAFRRYFDVDIARVKEKDSDGEIVHGSNRSTDELLNYIITGELSEAQRMEKAERIERTKKRNENRQNSENKKKDSASSSEESGAKDSASDKKETELKKSPTNSTKNLSRDKHRSHYQVGIWKNGKKEYSYEGEKRPPKEDMEKISKLLDEFDYFPSYSRRKRLGL